MVIFRPASPRDLFVKRRSSVMKRLHTAVFLLSVSLIALQIILMHALSIVQWHHFASMIISVALLGFGMAGSFLALFRERLVRHAAGTIPSLMVLSGLSMSLMLALSQGGPARFDTFLVFVEPAHRFALALTYLIFVVPFFFGALALGVIFVREVDNIGVIYAANLSGSGLGGLLGLAILWFLPPQQAIQLTAFVAILSGLAISSARRPMTVVGGAFGSAMCVVMFLTTDPLVPSEYKSLSKALTLPGAKIIAQRDSPEGRMQVVASSALRYAPGLSLMYRGDIPVNAALFHNGNWFGPVTSGSAPDSGHLLDYTTEALPYAVRHPKRVLVLGAGTGLNVTHALSNAAGGVDAVEQNSTAVKVLAEDLPGSDPFRQPGVTLHTIDPRTFLMRDTSQYDLAVIPVLEAFGGTSGLYAMQETFILTREAFAELWQHLAPSGFVSASSWVDNPVRTPLKLLATITATVQQAGVRNLDSHIVAIRSWGTVTIAAKRTPFDPEEIDRVRQFCREMKFDPLLLPGILPAERQRYNRLPGSALLASMDSIVHGSPGFRNTYQFNISPATDDRPFFFQFLRLENVLSFYRQFGSGQFPFLELGTFMLVLTLVQLIILAIVLIILPLFQIRWRRGRGRWSLPYFAALGLGYMFMEIVFIRHFTLYLGHPIIAAAVVITGMLVGSGVGSYASQRLPSLSARLVVITGGIVVLSILYVAVLGRFVTETISLPLALRVLLTLVWIAPPAVLMGMPFPIGLRQLAGQNDTLIPWAWGVNGCFSVIGAVLAAILALEFGFNAVMLGAGGAYGIALVTRAAVRVGR